LSRVCVFCFELIRPSLACLSPHLFASAMATDTKSSSSSSLKFYGNPVCPFAHRAWISLLEKGLEFEFVNIPLGDAKPKWYVDTVNPRGTVPTLELTDGKARKFVYESAIISEYVTEQYANQGNELMPSDPYLRAQLRFFFDEFGAVVGAGYGLLKNQDRAKDQELKDKLTAAVKKVLKLLNEMSAGPFVLGDKFSLGDVFALPFFDRFGTTLQWYRDYDIFLRDEAGTERLVKWYKAAMERDSFKKTCQTPQFYIDQYAHYAVTPINSAPKLRPAL